MAELLAKVSAFIFDNSTTFEAINGIFDYNPNFGYIGVESFCMAIYSFFFGFLNSNTINTFSGIYSRQNFNLEPTGCHQEKYTALAMRCFYDASCPRKFDSNTQCTGQLCTQDCFLLCGFFYHCKIVLL